MIGVAFRLSITLPDTWHGVVAVALYAPALGKGQRA